MTSRAKKRAIEGLSDKVMPLLGEADRLAFAWLEAGLSEHGITLAEFRIVGVLLGEPQGVNQKELARRLGIAPPSVSVALAKLEKAGHVARTVSVADSRARDVRLAEQMPSIDGVIELIGALEAKALAGVRRKDLEVTRATLNRIVENLSKPS